MVTKTTELLTREIEILTQGRDGIGKAWNVLKREKIEDEYLSEMYNAFDTKIKDYQNSLDILNEYYLSMCVSV